MGVKPQVSGRKINFCPMQSFSIGAWSGSLKNNLGSDYSLLFVTLLVAQANNQEVCFRQHIDLPGTHDFHE